MASSPCTTTWCRPRGIEGSEPAQVSVDVDEDVVVELGAFEEVEALDKVKRRLPTPKGAPLQPYFIKLSKINLAMDKHMPAG